jgi:hypothetical protein
VEAIGLLSWRKGEEDYMEYIRRLKKDPLAVKVKRCDLLDHLAPVNGDPDWLERNHPELYERYRKALDEIGD